MLTDDDYAIGKWLDAYVRTRDKVCQICHDSSSTTAANPLIVEYKSTDVETLPKHKNLWLVHYDCHEERQSQARCKTLRLEPRDTMQPLLQSRQKRPRYWTGRRVLALLVLAVDLALCYGCILFYKWCFRVFWP